MESAVLTASGLGLMFMLGLRHGLDPDHIAMIDSMAYRSLDRRPRLAPWIGSLFALGHGLTVTAVAVVLGAFAGKLALPAALHAALDWLPTLLLVLVGTLNLRGLLKPQPYQPRGWKSHFLPKALGNSSHPLAIFAVGALFALVFDTATQAAAWGYAATASAGSLMALLAGLAFTAGMLITDTLDGRVMVHLLRQTAGGADARAYRRAIGWTVVLLSYAMAAYEVATYLDPARGLSDSAMTAIGAALFLGLLASYLYLLRRRLQIRPRQASGN